jgi:hypothetical protein
MQVPTNEELGHSIELTQALPDGRCTHCGKPTGRIAPYYARLEIPKAGIVIRMPICETCVAVYLAMVENERPANVKKLRKTA